MVQFPESIHEAAITHGFTGVVAIHADGRDVVRAYGFAERRFRIPNTPDTRFAAASAAKGFTALAVMALVEDGTLALGTTARSLLGSDLPLIADDVTVEHLLAHRSGIGDYLDEAQHPDINEHAMPVPVHRLAEPEEYLAVLDGYPTVFAAGERFAYNNSGYVVLAILAERASGVPYHDLVRTRVTEPAGMVDTEFLRSDELPDRTALGYLDATGLRTNALHLPVRGVGDGGIHTTVADMRRFWTALFDGRIVNPDTVREMTRVRSDAGEDGAYGLGFWLQGVRPELQGYDAGVSFRSSHDPTTDTTWTVVSNTSGGAWPVASAVESALAGE
jgi:CubicO group peptidase (beta-lactamase class C family)